MVCAKCEKKLTKVACPEKWKDDSGSSLGPNRKINENKLLTKRKRWVPYGPNCKCKLCRSTLHQDAIYCHKCAYSKGVCAMCGNKVLDTALYKQSTA